MTIPGLTCTQLIQQLKCWSENGELERLLPELTALRGVPQPEDYHAEGDVFNHTLLAVEQLGENEDERLCWAVLLHDIGKAVTTRMIDGRLRAHGHDQKGAELAREILSRLGHQALADDVAWLIAHHHFALSWGEAVAAGLTPRQKRFCRQPLFPLLLRLCRADAAASLGVSRKGILLGWIEHHAAAL